MGRLARRIGEGQIDDALDDFGVQRGLAGRARLVTQQAINPLAHEAFLPAPDNRLRQSRPAHDLHCATAIGSGKNNAGASRMFLRAVAIPDDPIETMSILWRDFDDNCLLSSPEHEPNHRVRESFECVIPLVNPFTMALWGLIVAGSLAIGFLLFFAGLAVVVPVLAHSTWHLYRKVVEPTGVG
jgi:hypothetical protein